MKIWFLSILCMLVGCQTTSTKHIHLPEATTQINYQYFPQLKKTTQRPIVALVLGSGGSRGYAHIGVLEALEKHGIQPDFIVGTSAGSIVGALYASGQSAQQIKQTALTMKVQDVRDIKVTKQGFLDGQKLENFVNTQIQHQTLEHMKIPLYVVATELKTGKKTVFNQGNTGQAVRASVAIPSMFIPTKIKNEEYVDGGLVSPVPVEVAQELGADVIIAVDILMQPQYTETENMWGMFNQNINIMQQQLSQTELRYADVVIRPDMREKGHIFDTKEREKTLVAGELAAEQQIMLIKNIIQQREHENLLTIEKRFNDQIQHN